MEKETMMGIWIIFGDQFLYLKITSIFRKTTVLVGQYNEIMLILTVNHRLRSGGFDWGFSWWLLLGNVQWVHVPVSRKYSIIPNERNNVMENPKWVRRVDREKKRKEKLKKQAPPASLHTHCKYQEDISPIL